MKYKLMVIGLIVLSALILITDFGGSKEPTTEPEDVVNSIFGNMTSVKVLKPITIEIEGIDSNMTLIVGEELLIIQSNTNSMVMIETMTGLKSWVNVDKNNNISGTEYKLSEVFEVIR